MFYRDTGRLPTSYAAQFALIARPEDRYLALIAAAVLIVAVPLVATPYVINTLLVPLLILGLAATGLNLLMGFAGQPSLGSGAFMAIGAYTSYKLATNLPGIPVIADFFVAGAAASALGVVFGLPSLRMKAFYLAIATLGAQFFFEWLFSKVPWFWNNHASGVVSTPPVAVLGIAIDTPIRGYYFLLVLVALMTLAAVNLTRSHIGRRWMAVRDNETAARLMGISVVRAKLSAFAISSFYCGVAGALWAFVFLKSLGITSYSVDTSLKIMFMIVIGGLGSILGSYIGTAFILLVPILLNVISAALDLPLSAGTVSYLEQIIFGVMLVYFVVAEPQGLVRSLYLLHQRLISWPLVLESKPSFPEQRSNHTKTHPKHPSLPLSERKILILSDVDVVYDETVLALRRVSLSIENGQIVALLGANGAGKTTTLKTISNLISVERGIITHGQIIYEGREIQGASPDQLVRAGIVQVMEGRRCFPNLTVDENLEVAVKRSRRPDRTRVMGKTEIYDLFPRLALHRTTKAGLLSGGEQQMLAIGRALLTQPKLLLLDEPSIGLAPKVVAQIFTILKKLNRELGLSILVAEQNARVALRHADYGYVLANGQVIKSGSARELSESKDMRHFYLGTYSSEEGAGELPA